MRVAGVPSMRQATLMEAFENLGVVWGLILRNSMDFFTSSLQEKVRMCSAHGFVVFFALYFFKTVKKFPTSMSVCIRI